MNPRLNCLALAAATAALLAGCASQPSGFGYSAPILPEAASGYQAKPGWATTKFAVAAANPLATDAGYQVLKAGGSAKPPASEVSGEPIESLRPGESPRR